MITQMPYEQEMQIIFDMVSRTTVVSFRGMIKMFGPFEERWEAIHAGEQFCRDNGWIETSIPVSVAEL